MVRFATELGFSGYPKLQKALQELIKNKLTSVQRLELSNDLISEENALKGVLKADIENIRATLEKINHKTFDEVVNSVCKTPYLFLGNLLVN